MRRAKGCARYHRGRREAWLESRWHSGAQQFEAGSRCWSSGQLVEGCSDAVHAGKSSTWLFFIACRQLFGAVWMSADIQNLNLALGYDELAGVPADKI